MSSSNDRDVNGIYYINANLPAPQATLVGADNRARWTTNRIHSQVQNAIVMKNQNEGTSWNMAGMLTRNFRDGFFVKTAYSYGQSKNTIDPGSIAFGSWTANAHSATEHPGVGFRKCGHRSAPMLVHQGSSVRVDDGVGVWIADNGNASYTFAATNGTGRQQSCSRHREVSAMNSRSSRLRAAASSPGGTGQA